MFKLQKQNYKQDKSGERVDFRFSNFQLLQVLPSRSFLFFDLCYFLLFLVLLLSHYYFVGVIILYFLISKTTLKNVFLYLKQSLCCCCCFRHKFTFSIYPLNFLVNKKNQFSVRFLLLSVVFFLDKDCSFIKGLGQSY